MKPQTVGRDGSYVWNDDVRLFFETDGSGEPVTVVAHGLTNSRRELAAFTPMIPGTIVRFDFRGHGLSSVPATGYAIGDFASDVDSVATAFSATRAVGTSLGAAAICRLLESNPRRFEKLVFILPAFLDQPVRDLGGLTRAADIMERSPKEEAIAAIIRETGRQRAYERAPWLREFDEALWEDLDTVGAAKAIRGIIGQAALGDREILRTVDAPALIICREGDAVHPAEVGRAMHERLPNSELIVLAGEEELFAAIPELASRAATFLS
jgi:3-oxoadipate enol-lactonase